MMGLDGGDLLNDGDEFGGGGGGGGGGGEEKVAAATVDCSICFDAVTDDGERSWVKLQCSHQFHLDCIGSAFNAKGAMECPNCRKIEKGRWLYAKGSQLCPDSNNGNLIPIDDPYESFYDEWVMNSSGLAQLSSPFDEGEFSSSPTYSGATAPTAAHMSGRPHIAAYHEAIHPSLSTSIHPAYSNIDDVAVFMGLVEEHEFIPMHLSSRHIRGRGDEQRSAAVSLVSQRDRRIPTTTTTTTTTTTYDDRRQQGPFFIDLRSGRSVTTSTTTTTTTTAVQPYPGSMARTRGYVQALEAYHQQSSNPVSTRALSGIISSSGSSGSRSDGQNNIRIPNLPPIPSPSNHAAAEAVNRLHPIPSSSSSSSSRRNYHHQPPERGGYEPPWVRYHI